ncbi:hypothetical protein IQ241_14635 [Romeria aff. gracilis LEGE 07310]|uniref:histidine kinase n=1 Tax=Vasconcelosia minhoensis LEGE 07310 TaxID=915328 RepID=A0A8J7DC43_9CYAN|nr:ATP-binding protein [Romeria gracilis]MBE9078517.1 hypothetical protein [Romeria aff. gracilis LEGE 07310]
MTHRIVTKASIQLGIRDRERRAILDLTLRPVEDDTGRIVLVALEGLDISDRKRLETQLLRCQRLETIGSLAGSIACNLINTLAPISGVAKLLRLQLTAIDDDTHEMLQLLESSANRADDLVQQIVSFLQGGEGNRTLLGIKQLLSEVQQLMQATFPASIEIQTCFSLDLWPIEGDQTQLYQVLLNLCLNARDAMPEGGILRLSAENLRVNVPNHLGDASSGRYLVITVSDTGSGIPSRTLDKIFEPFFTTKAPDQGTGLGLSKAMDIVESHGGFIDVFSAEEAGTQFGVFLPALMPTEPVAAPS